MLAVGMDNKLPPGQPLWPAIANILFPRGVRCPGLQARSPFPGTGAKKRLSKSGQKRVESDRIQRCVSGKYTRRYSACCCIGATLLSPICCFTHPQLISYED